MGEPDKASLQADLESAGWRAERRGGDDWWVHEYWELQSTWRPVGAKIFLTLLVDPQSETSDIRSIWAISVSSRQPVDRIDAERTAIRVAPHWPRRIEEVVEAANSLRPAPSP
jgi:hypothetical protein